MLRALLVSCLLLTTGIVNAAESRPQWADPDRWEFVGSLSFDVARLRDGLASDIDVLLASRTPLDPERLATVLADRLTAGYRHSGFPDVEVTSEVITDRERIVLTVNEGPSYRNGDVRIDGAKTIPVAELITGLTEGTGPQDVFLRWSQPPEKGGVREWIKANGEVAAKETAVWKRDKSTSFSSNLEQNVVSKAKLILQRCGYLDASVSAALEPQTDGRTTLVVTIEDEGPRAILGDVEVHGGKFNTAEQILNYLGVQPGQELDIESAPRWQWKLQESARFYETKVQVTPPPFGTGPSRLDVHVIEIPDLPTLDQPLTPTQQAAVRAARWMTEPKKEDWQLILTVRIIDAWRHYLLPAWRKADTVSVRLTLSAPDAAALLEFDLRDDQSTPLWTAHAHFNRDQLQLVNLLRKAKLSFDVADTKLILTANWTVRKPDAEGRASAMSFGFGFNHNGETDHRVPEIKTIVAPSALLVESLKPEFQTSLHDGVLKLVCGETLLEFDAESGRLLHFTAKDEDKLQVTLRAETGLYQTRRKELAAAHQGCTEVMRDNARLTQACRFLIDELIELDIVPFPRQPEALPLARRLLDAGVLRGIDQELQPRAEEDRDVTERRSFEIPAAAPKGPPHPLAWLKPCLHMCLGGYSAVFPRETGGWVAGREAALSLLGGRQGAVPPGRVVEMLDEADAGPISFLLAAELFHFVSPYHRYVLANAAADRLDSPAIRSDLRVLANDRSFAGKVVLAIATALRDASAEDLSRMAGWVTRAQYEDVLKPAFEELSRRKDEPLSQVLPDVLEQVYPSLIRPALVAELQRLEGPIQAAQAKPELKPQPLPEAPFNNVRPNRQVPEPLPDLSKQQFLPNRD